MIKTFLFICSLLIWCKGFLIGQNHEYKIDIEGKERVFRITIPEKYPDSLKLPIIFVLHGYDNIVEDMGIYSEMDKMANKAGFIAVYPEGTKNINGYYTWNAGDNYVEWTQNANDVLFIDTLITYLEINYPIDTTRIYIAGHGNGSMMAYRLAAELSERIAAIACISGQMVDSQSIPTQSVPIMHVHGDNDIILPHTGNEQYGFQVAAIDKIIKKWLQWNKCSTVPTVLKYDAKVTALQWKGNAEVRLYLLHDLGHDWPTLQRGNWPATEYIWNFFKDIRK
jgi:polyhydroxybutyrate depolymerase